MLRSTPLNLVQLTMEKNIRWCPTFSNLINLTVDTSCVRADFYVLIVFLQNSPNVKKLTLKLNQVCVLGHIMDYSVNVYACTMKKKPIVIFFLARVMNLQSWAS
jgi:hypothetical protein